MRAQALWHPCVSWQSYRPLLRIELSILQLWALECIPSCLSPDPVLGLSSLQGQGLPGVQLCGQENHTCLLPPRSPHGESRREEGLGLAKDARWLGLGSPSLAVGNLAMQ